jgi:hypothetical protein
MGNIIDLNEFRNAKLAEPSDFDWDKIDPAKLMNLYNDLMNTNGADVHTIMDTIMIDFSRFIITCMYDAGIDPEDPQLSQDLIFISMLINSAIEEYYKDSFAQSNGIENTMYRFLKQMKEGELSS